MTKADPGPGASAAGRFGRAAAVWAVVASGGFVVVAAGAVPGCAEVPTFDRLAAADRELYVRCRPPLGDTLCGGAGDDAAKGACLDARADVFAAKPTLKARRRWLAASGCPESVMDTPPPPPAPPPVPKSTLEIAAASKSTLEIAAPTKSTLESGSTTLESGSTAPKSTLESGAESGADSKSTLEGDGGPKSTSEGGEVKATSEGGGPKSTLEGGAGEAGGRGLREIIVAHKAEMRTCVDWQLKLSPKLRAEGKLVIQVNAKGAVPAARLVGEELAGTRLETCLRGVASRWRFPRRGRAYVIEAPVKVGAAEPAP